MTFYVTFAERKIPAADEFLVAGETACLLAQLSVILGRIRIVLVLDFQLCLNIFHKNSLNDVVFLPYTKIIRKELLFTSLES